MATSETRISPRLPIDRMHERHAGLTPEVAACYHQAASVCLDRHHSPPVNFELLDGSRQSNVEVDWVPTTPAVRGAWANSIDTTEAGAYACALAGAEFLRGLVAVRRAETGTGSDYYVGPPGSGTNDLEDCLRLEVSGVDAGNASVLNGRLRAKLKQAQEGASNLPALAGVVGFQAARILIADVPEGS
jgi:hypothetical protein